MYLYVCMYMCLYVCMYIFMYVCVYVCVCRYVGIYVCINLCMCVCIYVYVLIYVYVYTCVYVCRYVYMYMCMCACVHVYVCMYVCIHTCIYVYEGFAPLRWTCKINTFLHAPVRWTKTRITLFLKTYFSKKKYFDASPLFSVPYFSNQTTCHQKQIVEWVVARWDFRTDKTVDQTPPWFHNRWRCGSARVPSTSRYVA